MEKQYGVGIVGTGAIASFHAIAAENAEGARLVACHSHHPERCDAFAASHGNIRSYHDLESFMSDDDIDIVMIATPPSAHLEEVLSAISHRKKAVIVEKPLEITSERCALMISKAEESGVMLSGIFQSRFFEASKLIKNAVDGGRFGRITLIDAQFKWLRTQEYFDSVPWRGRKESVGGGILMNQGIHAIDLLQWFGGDVANVSGRTALLGHSGIDVEDTASAVLQFRSGALGVIEGTSASYPARVWTCSRKAPCRASTPMRTAIRHPSPACDPFGKARQCPGLAWPRQGLWKPPQEACSPDSGRQQPRWHGPCGQDPRI